MPCMCGAEDCPRCFPNNTYGYCENCGKHEELVQCDECERYLCGDCLSEDDCAEHEQYCADVTQLVE